MQGNASISLDVLMRYAIDAATGVPGVDGPASSALPHRRPVKIEAHGGDRVDVELRLVTEWGASIPDVAREVQHQVRSYLERMAAVGVTRVDVLVDDVAPPR